MPLGMARASEYAGWWSGGPLIIQIDSTSTISQEVYQTPVFSFNDPGDNNGPDYVGLNVFIAPDFGNAAVANLSSYTSSTGFNDYATTVFSTIRPNLASGITNNTDVTRYELKQVNNGNSKFPIYIGLAVMSTGSLGFNGRFDSSFVLPGAYTDWNDNWLTVVWSTAESSSSFTSWGTTATTSTTYAQRRCIYNTETGELLLKVDRAIAKTSFDFELAGSWITASGNTMSFSDNASTGDYNFRIICNSGGFYGANAQPMVETNHWISYGTGFDPLAVKATDSTWLTTRPNAQIGNARAWMNMQFVGYDSQYVSPRYLYSVKTSGMDLMSQASNRQAELVNSVTASDWTNNYSTTDIPKDKS
jgi:hypothetical protein